MKFPHRIVIATRESPLALWQAKHVAERLRMLHPGMETVLLGMTTEGDRRLATSLATLGGKGLFVKELEQALSEGRADIAVHSMKDVPMHLPAGFAIAAITEREDPRDALVSNGFRRLSELPSGARVGTSSLRRESQLRARHARLQVLPLRGNVHTRLRKLDEGRFEAVVLAAAGLKRLGLQARISCLLEPVESLPAVGQGALGVECRAERVDLIELLAPLNHPPSRWCVEAERALSRALAGSCTVPLGALARFEGTEVRLRGFVAAADGSRMIYDEASASGHDSPEALGQALAGKLIAKGAREVLAMTSLPRE
ncbi:MAG TPA: hydroxymethylbilane synthase [Burkholderiales bacterium]|nr:hydroxymethylbilane synthase [Burkholderiales bacterium]